jgi:hypothetical protein
MVLGPPSVALAWAATRHLGKQWRYEAALSEDHELIQTGPYRWVRHPIYASMLGMLQFASWQLLTKGARPVMWYPPSAGSARIGRPPAEGPWGAHAQQPGIVQRGQYRWRQAAFPIGLLLMVPDHRRDASGGVHQHGVSVDLHGVPPVQCCLF